VLTITFSIPYCGALPLDRKNSRCMHKFFALLRPLVHGGQSHSHVPATIDDDDILTQ
jgi:hypothetical protein